MKGLKGIRKLLLGGVVLDPPYHQRREYYILITDSQWILQTTGTSTRQLSGDNVAKGVHVFLTPSSSVIMLIKNIKEIYPGLEINKLAIKRPSLNDHQDILTSPLANQFRVLQRQETECSFPSGCWSCPKQWTTSGDCKCNGHPVKVLSSHSFVQFNNQEGRCQQ